MTVIFWTSLLVLFYAFIGYPIVMLFLGRKKRPVQKDPAFEPRVTLLVSAYNEESVIAEKVANSLDLNYPQDLLEIIVVSDGSTDKTNEIVSGTEDPRLKFISYDERGGKVKALNAGMQHVTGDVVVLTDANVIFEKDAIKKLVANLADESIGCVIGNVVLKSADGKPAGESLYSRYEKAIHAAEGAWKTMITVDGAMYAIRREFLSELPPDTITDDWYLCTGVLLKFKRIIFESDAVGYEPAAESVAGEFTRKVRMVAGGYQTAIRRASIFFGPLKYPCVSYMFVSHKLMRWLAGFFMILLYASNLILAGTGDLLYQVVLFCQTVFFLAGLLGYLLRSHSKSPVFYVPYYFLAVNWASILGLLRYVFGKQQVTWQRGRH